MSGQVDERVKEERSEKLISIGEELMRSFAARFVGKVCTSFSRKQAA